MYLKSLLVPLFLQSICSPLLVRAQGSSSSPRSSSFNSTTVLSYNSTVPGTTSATTSRWSASSTTSSLISSTPASSNPILPNVSTSRGSTARIPPSTPTTTFTDTAISLTPPSPTSTSGAGSPPTAIVVNPDNPAETVVFGKETLPQNQRDGLPHIDDAAPLALLLLLDGTETLVTINSKFVVVYPEGAVPPWLTLDLFPVAETIGEDEPSASASSNSPSSSSSSPSSSTSSGASATETSYLLMTKPGTSNSDFQNFIKTFPDGGSGQQIVYSHVSFQFYVTSINDSYAAIVAQNPLVLTVVLNAAISDDTYGAIPRQGFSRRADKKSLASQNPRKEIFKRRPTPPTNNLVRQAGSQTPLKIISQGTANSVSNVLEDFLYDPIAGKGVSIYILDSGFFVGAQDFLFDAENWVPDEDYHIVDANLLGEPSNFPNRQSLQESKPHGTCVASMAVGKTWGVAKNARMVPVKFKNEGGTRPGAIADAFAWAIDNVNKNELEGQAVINLSYGFPIAAPSSTGSYDITTELFDELLKECWENGIVTVIAAGNEGQAGLNLGKRLPQSLGSTNNPLITVGGIENDGSLWIDTTPEGNGPSPGSITVSLAANVQCASSTISNGVQTAKGTSFAAPQVAGIAAYFLSLPSLKAQLQQGGMSQVAQNVKNYIVQAAFRRGGDSNPLSAYNLAEDAICLAEIPAAKRSLPKRDGPDIETVLADGTLVATDVNVPCKATRSSSTSNSAATSSGASSSTANSISSSAAFSVSSSPVAAPTLVPAAASSTTLTLAPVHPVSSSSVAVPTLVPAATVPAAASSAPPLAVVVAPPITVPTATSTACVNGYATYSLHAVVTAPANAASVKIYVPAADQPGTNWNVTFDEGFFGNPADDVSAWQVSIDPQGNGGATNIVSSGNTGDPINWNTPSGAHNIVVELLFKAGLGEQTFGIDIYGMGLPCTPTSCSGPPTITTINGAVCTINACSNDPICEAASTPTPNLAGTNVHAVDGCISINGSPRCPNDSPYNVADQNQPYSTATLYGGFNSAVTIVGNVQPGCELDARWPANYGDIYFNAVDGCLYDSSNTSIGGECCTSSTTAQVTNPYAKFAASCQRTPGFGFVHFEIYLNSDITDGGKALHDQVDGCGAVTLWQFGTNESNEKDGSSANLGYYTSQYLASFNIDILFKTGCVGRAIHSAGGPAGVDC